MNQIGNLQPAETEYLITQPLQGGIGSLIQGSQMPIMIMFSQYG